MSKTTKVLSWIGTLAGAIALICLGITLVVVAAAFIIGLETLDIPAVGPLIYLAPGGLAVGGIVIWLLSKLTIRILGADEPSEERSAQSTPAAESEQPMREGPEAQLHQFNRANKYLALFFLVLLGFSYPYLEPGTGSYVVAVMTFSLCVVMLTAVGLITYFEWDVFDRI
jgi:hypothetical protein